MEMIIILPSKVTNYTEIDIHICTCISTSRVTGAIKLLRQPQVAGYIHYLQVTQEELTGILMLA